jgi:hypothetical protein
MENSHNWMARHHSRPGVLHHSLDPLPHLRPVAVYRTAGTDRFSLAEGAFIQSRHGVVFQVAAFGAQLSRPVMGAAVHADHRPDGACFATWAAAIVEIRDTVATRHHKFSALNVELGVEIAIATSCPWPRP